MIWCSFGRSRRIMRLDRATLPLLAATLSLAAAAAGQELVTFPTEDGARIYADLYGEGGHGVVLAHGARFDRRSWQEQAAVLVESGFSVLAIDFRGYGQSQGPGDGDAFTAPLYQDVLAAVRFLRAIGSDTVSVIGASLGGIAAADAAIASEYGEIDRLVLLAAHADGPSEDLKGRKLFVVARDDVSGAGPRLPGIRDHYERAPEPKELLVLEGSAHAQQLFETHQGARLLSEIVRFLMAP
jgi:alpha/beta superfamily hydrolase